MKFHRLALGVALLSIAGSALAGTQPGTVPEPETWLLVALAAGVGYLAKRLRK